MITKRQAIAEVRACANAIIEQLERHAKGWDKGIYRDDDTLRMWTIRETIKMNVDVAFGFSKDFAK